MALLRRLLAFALTVGLVLLVAVALLVSVARFALPYAGEYRDALASLLSERLGYQVSIGSLSMRLSGLEPRLSLSRVVLEDAETKASVLSLKGMVLHIDPLASLRDRSPKITSLTLVGARLAVQRRDDGQIQVVGLGALKSDNPRALELFLGQGRLNLTDTEILFEDERFAKPLVRLVDTNLTVHNDGPRHWIDLTARPLPPGPSVTAFDPSRRAEGSSGRPPDRLRLMADLKGPPEDLRAWDGRLYVGLSAGDLGALVPPEALDGYALEDGRLVVEGWGEVQSGRLIHAVVRQDLTNLEVSAPAAVSKTVKKMQPTRIRHLNALVRLRAEDPGWRVESSNLQATLGDASLSGVDVEMLLDPKGHLRGLGLAANSLRLEDLAAILDAAPIHRPEGLSSLLEARPQGVVRGLALRFAGPANARPEWALSADFDALSWNQRGHVPGAKGLSGKLSANQDRGDLLLDAKSAVLDLNPLFSNPILVDSLEVPLSWARNSLGDWYLASRQMRVRNADVSGSGTLGLQFPADGSSPVLDLEAEFGNGNAAHTRTYLPVGTMSPKLVAWLEQAIVSGRLTKGTASFHGRVADYPFRNKKGDFELYLAFEDTLFNYEQGWPVMKATAGDLRFLNEGLRIRLDRGRIFETSVSGGEAVIPDLKAAQNMIITARADGPLADGLHLLSDSPLADRFGRLADALVVSGQSRLDLTIDLPLHHGRELGLKGRLTWPSPATLGIKGADVELSRLDGALEFTEQSLNARAVKADLWGRPVLVSVASQGESNPETSTTRIEASAATELSELAKRFPSDLWASLGGRLNWTLAVTLKNREVSQERPTLGYRLSSDLRGVSIDLPSPLGKSTKPRRSLEILGDLVPGQGMSVAGHLGDVGLNLNLDFGRAAIGPSLKGGRIRFGDASPPAPEGSGLVLDGAIEALDLDPWLAWSDSRARGKTARSRSGASDMLRDLKVRQFKVGRLQLGDHALDDVTLDADRRFDGWDVRLDAPAVAGLIKFRSDSSAGPMSLTLDRLNLEPLLESEPTRKRRSKTPSQVDELPSADLRVAHLRWGKADLGALGVALRRTESGLSMSHFKLDGRDALSIRGSGQWTKGPEGGRSRVEFTASTSDLKHLLDGLDDRSALEAGAAKAEVKLNWRGGFGDFALKRAGGVIDLDVGEGRFLDVDPGLGRVLGFLNVGALSRRLALDFSDIYDKGFVFEQMKGRIKVGAGKATFESFSVDGPAGKIGVAGTTDLVAQRFDQTVTVEPKLGSSVALASAVAGGPVVGAAVLLVDKVAGNPIDRLSRYRYKVTGPWSSPVLRRMGWEPSVLEPSKPEPKDPKPVTKPEPSSPTPKPERNLFLELR